MSMTLKAAGNAQRAMPGIGYRGDPGIFGFLGNVAKGVTGAVSKLGIPGVSGVAGIASRTLSGILGNKTQKARQLQVLAQPLFPGQTGGARLPFQQPTPGVLGSIQRALPGGATGMQAGGPPGAGYHLNKSDYFLKSGQFVPKGTVWVKNRRRNPFNPRAIDRAIGRVSAAKRATARLGRITIRKAC